MRLPHEDLERAALSERLGEPDPDSAERLPRVEDLPSLFALETAPITWLIDGLLPEGCVVMISGDSGSGKSTLATAWGAHIALGVPFAGRATAQREVLILDRENPAPVVKDRLLRLGTQDGGGLRFWGGWLEHEAPHPCSAAILEWVARTSPKPVIAVDSAIAFLLGDENSSTDVRKFLHPLRQLAAAGATILLLHHSGKGDSTLDYRGSSDWKAGIDVGFVLANIGDPARFARVRLRCFKRRIDVVSDLILEFDESSATFYERGGNSKQDADSAIAHAILTETGNLTGKAFEDEAVRRGLGRNRARAILDNWTRSGKVRQTGGPRGSKLHSLADSFLFTGDEVLQ